MKERGKGGREKNPCLSKKRGADEAKIEGRESTSTN